MRIGIPYEDGRVCPHFGHAPQYKIYQLEEGKPILGQVLDTKGAGHEAIANFLTALEVRVVICGNIGAEARNALTARGIAFYGGVSGDADTAVRAYAGGTLMYNPNVGCEAHDCGGGDCGGCCGDCGSCHG